MYLDANFFIIARGESGKKGDRARQITRQIVAGKKAITSSLALDEVMCVYVKNKLQHELRAFIEEIYSIRNLEIKEVSPLIPLRALEFMEQCNLKPRDAFHVAIMEQFGVHDMVTDDADFDRVEGITRIPL